MSVGEKRQMLLCYSFRSSKALTVFVVAYAIFVDLFVFTVVVPVLPFSLQTRAGLSGDSGSNPLAILLDLLTCEVQYWVSVLVAVYGIGIAVISPFWGWYTDRSSSRRTPFLIGLVLLLGGTLILWFTTNLAAQVVARLLQGIASGICWISGMALIADRVGQEDVGYYLSYLSISTMVGNLIAPLLGGVVFAKAGYDAVFAMTVASVGLDIILRLVLLEQEVTDVTEAKVSTNEKSNLSTENTKMDSPVKVDYSTPINTDVEGRRKDEEDVTHVVGRAETLLDNSGPKIQKRWLVRLPNFISFLSSRRLLSALFGTFVMGIIICGLAAVLPLETQSTFGWDSVGGGLIFLPIAIPALLGPAVGRLCDRFGPRWLAALGYLMLCPTFVLLRFVKDNTLNQKVLLCALLTLVGCCLTATFDPLMAETAYIVGNKAQSDPEAYGSTRKAYAQAFALYNIAFSVGGAVGPFIVGFLRDNQGWATMSWVLGLISGITAIPTVLLCGGWIGDRDARWK